MDNAPIASPRQSQMITPIPAWLEFLKTAASKLEFLEAAIAGVKGGPWQLMADQECLGIIKDSFQPES